MQEQENSCHDILQVDRREERFMRNFVVTFARGFGSGGKAIASTLARELGIHCYENRILTLASQMSGLDEKLFQEVNEKLSKNSGFSSFLQGLPRSKSYIARNEKFVSDDRLFEYQCKIIKNLADTEPCVIVGKCADYVLRGRDNVVSIYIEAPRSFCVERTMENMGVSEKVAHSTIEKTDKYRADYYKYYTGGNYWTNPVNYDMTLNSERVGIDHCIDIIEQYLIIKGFITESQIKKDRHSDKGLKLVQ
jgi:cytidylate kinase